MRTYKKCHVQGVHRGELSRGEDVSNEGTVERNMASSLLEDKEPIEDMNTC